MYQNLGDIQCDICVGCTDQRAPRPECDITENFNMDEYLNIFISNIFYPQTDASCQVFFAVNQHLANSDFDFGNVHFDNKYGQA